MKWSKSHSFLGNTRKGHPIDLDRRLGQKRGAICEMPPLNPIIEENPDGVKALFKRISCGIRKTTGIELSDRHMTKFFRKYNRFRNLEEVACWVNRMEGTQYRHHEWQDMIENMTVHETYFYRDKNQMSRIRNEILPGIIKREKKKSIPGIRIWSAACSTGEEVYTVTLLLLETLIANGEAVEASPGEIGIDTRWSIDILGTDISNMVINKAKKAIYGNYPLGPFREMPPPFKRFFAPCYWAEHPAIEGRRIKESVRRLVRFQNHNLTSSKPPLSGFDLILCRNVMIYFDESSKKNVQFMLYNALTKGGILVLGPTDTLLYPEYFEPVWGKGSVYYVKK